jgi:DNA-binding transcriptional MerR regulator
MNMGTNKDNYLFNEITSMTGVKPYVLRFWESEFEQIDPVVLEDGEKVYREEDLATIQKIKGLLFDEKMSIQETKKALRLLNPPTIEEQSADLKQSLEKASEKERVISFQQIENPKKLAREQKREELIERLHITVNKLDQIISARNW